MALATYEAVIENGQIRLFDQVTLPEKTRVYVVVAPPLTATPDDALLAMFRENPEVPVWSPLDAHEAAAALLDALERDKATR